MPLRLASRIASRIVLLGSFAARLSRPRSLRLPFISHPAIYIPFADTWAPLPTLMRAARCQTRRVALWRGYCCRSAPAPLACGSAPADGSLSHFTRFCLQTRFVRDIPLPFIFVCSCNRLGLLHLLHFFLAAHITRLASLQKLFQKCLSAHLRAQIPFLRAAPRET